MKELLEYFVDLKDIFSKPGVTLARLMEIREYRAAIVAVFLSVVLLSYLSLPEAMARASRMTGDGGTQIPINFTFVALAAMFAVFISLSIGAFMVYLFYGAAGVKGEYGNFFALVVNASLIDTAVPNVVMALSVVMDTNITKFAGLAGYFGGLEVKSLAYLALMQLNVFTVWYIVVVAAGVAVFARLSFKKSMMIGIFYFGFKTVVVVLFKYLVNVMGRNLGI